MDSNRWMIRPFDDARPRQGNRTLVLHLSDLHFTSATDWHKPPFSALVGDLGQREHKPDLVVCTGDLIDSSVSDSVLHNNRIDEAMKRARDFLVEGVCRTCQVEPPQALFVVPGNHDCRVKGIIGLKVLRLRFMKYFSEYFRSALLPGMNLLLCSFDSNTTDWAVNLATGHVEQQEFVDLGDWLVACRKHPRFPLLTKIALLHHHPMPIAETETVGKTDPVQFMILRNAATFMREMLKAGFDLILHGHEHLIGYSCASFPLRRAVREIAVVSAGSAGEPNDGSYRSFNLLTIPLDGPIAVEQQVLRSGTYDALPVFHVPEGYAAWRHKKAERRAEHPDVVIRGKAIVSDIEIDAAGDSARIMIQKGIRAKAAAVSSVPMLSVSMAAKFEEPKCALLNNTQRTVSIKSNAGTTGEGKVEYEMVFAPALTTDDCIDVELRREAFNSFFFDAQDRLDVLPRSTAGASQPPEDTAQVSGLDPSIGSESAGMVGRQMFDSLSLTVRFCHDREIIGPRVEVTSLDEPQTVDLEESKYCNERLSYSARSGIAHLAIDFPIPRHTYAIVWNLPREAQPPFDARTNGEIEMLERAWAECRNNAPLQTKLYEGLKELRSELTRELSSPHPETDIEVALLYFDTKPEARKLKVAAGLYPPADAIYGWSLKKGQGIEGQALRRRMDMVCFANSDVWQHYYQRPDTAPPDRCVFASCLTYPINSPRVACIARIATRAVDSPLLFLEGDLDRQAELVKVVHRHYIRSVLPALGLGPRYAIYGPAGVSHRSVEELLDG